MAKMKILGISGNAGKWARGHRLHALGGRVSEGKYIVRSHVGDGESAHCKSMLCTCEDLSLNSQLPHKKPEMALWTYNPSFVNRDQKILRTCGLASP